MAEYITKSDFLGDAEKEETRATFKELISLAQDIRSRLGGKGYLLDAYMRNLVAVATELFVCEAAENGFSTAMDLNGICTDVSNGTQKHADKRFYAVAKDYADKHPLTLESPNTKQALYKAALADKYRLAEYQDAHSELGQSLCFDDLLMRDLSERIVGITGDAASMERLNALFLQRFARVSFTDMFMQGEACDLLYALDLRDIETDKTVMQLLLDEMLPLDEV